MSDPFNFEKDSMTQKVIGVSQALPFWGKRALKGEVAAREAEASRWTIEERKLELARMVKETYYQLAFVERSMAILDRNLTIAADFVTLAETRYEVGQAAQQDIFKAQLDRSKMLDMRLALEQQRRSLQATLNALLNRPADTPIGTIPLEGAKAVSSDAGQLLHQAEEHRPLFKEIRSRIAKGEAGHRLAQKDAYPDFTLFLELMQRNPVGGDQGLNMYTLGVTFNLPIQRERREAMQAEASSETAMAGEELNAARNSIRAGIADLLAQLERRRQQAELYRSGIIPQAEKALESSVASYRVGKVDFLTLLDSRSALFSYEREYQEALAEQQMRRAQLEALVGMTLE
jgi:outer membrane protein TolC